MNSMKKAARIGGKDLAAGIASASASAKARIAKLDSQDIDGVAGGIDLGGDTGGIGGVGGGTAGMIDPDPIGDAFKTFGS